MKTILYGGGLLHEAMRLFCRIYGQTAGGIAPKILALLKQPEFLDGLHTKGRFAEWMRHAPVSKRSPDGMKWNPGFEPIPLDAASLHPSYVLNRP